MLCYDDEFGRNDYRSYLMHHGIKGQHWGDRNGPPYPLTGAAKAKAYAKDKLRSIGKSIEEKKKQRRHIKIEKLKASINTQKIKNGVISEDHKTAEPKTAKTTTKIADPKDMLKNQSEFTTNELQAYINRYNAVKSIESLSKDRHQDVWKRIENVSNKLNTINNLADRVNKLYGHAKRVSKLFGDDKSTETENKPKDNKQDNKTQTQSETKTEAKQKETKEPKAAKVDNKEKEKKSKESKAHVNYDDYGDYSWSPKVVMDVLYNANEVKVSNSKPKLKVLDEVKNTKLDNYKFSSNNGEDSVRGYINAMLDTGNFSWYD